MKGYISGFQHYTKSFLSTFGVLGLLLQITVYGSNGRFEKKEEEQSVVWHTFDKAQAKAAEKSKPLFIFVEAEWCLPCKRMKNNVFPKKEISRLLNSRYYPVSIDVDSRENFNYSGTSISERDFARKMKISTTPTIIFMKADGTELGRQPGAVDSDELITLLRFVDSEYFGRLSLEEFQNMDSLEH